MPIVRERDIKEVKRDLKKTETKLDGTNQAIEIYTKIIADGESDKDIREALEKKKEELPTLQEQYLSLQQKFKYMTEGEETKAPWEKERPAGERSLFFFSEGSA